MDFVGSTKDLYSFSKPEDARVTDTRLELNVDFKRKVLQGKAILIIERKFYAKEIILDYYELIIKSVSSFSVKLRYRTELSDTFGNLITIRLPISSGIMGHGFKCKIEIEYETSPNSPALHWLTPAQTADGLYPFLLSDNKLIYARAMFPCQDTPSVKFTYSAEITVPRNFRVLMSAPLQDTSVSTEQVVYKFLQTKAVPSYAVIIAVGSLQERQLGKRSNVYAENKFINESIDMFSSGMIKSMLRKAKSICGLYPWDKYHVCVLPPSIAHFKIECPCVTFISPLLLHGDLSVMKPLAFSISQSWAGNLVTCANYNHLWLNKSFSMFITRKILCKMLVHEEAMCFIKKAELDKLNSTIQELRKARSLYYLLPHLTGLSLHDAIKCVPYGLGCMLLDCLEHLLGGFLIFEQFLKYYFNKFAYQSINTKDWIDCLHIYFPNETKLSNIIWSLWFLDTDFTPIVLQRTAWETNCYNTVKEWLKLDDNVDDKPTTLTCQTPFHDIEKVLFLSYLYVFHTGLTKKKLKLISNFYMFDTQNRMIRFAWLQLCIKVRCEEKVAAALNFAITFCSPNYTCPIFEHLYEWPEMRQLAINEYKKNKEKMLRNTQIKLDEILHLQ